VGESRYPLPTFYASFVLLQASPEIAGARAGVAYYAGGGGVADTFPSALDRPN